MLADRRISWIGNGIREGAPKVKTSLGLGSKPGGEVCAV